MATYIGSYTEEYEGGFRQPSHFNGILDTEEYEGGFRQPSHFNGIIDDYSLGGLRVQRVESVIITSPFYWEDDVPVEKHGIRQPTSYVGMITWGDGNVPPRRYPLELSWRSPIKQ
jgi:hypothetical protein